MLVNIRRTTVPIITKNPSFSIPLLLLHSLKHPKTPTLNPPKPLSKPQLEDLVLTRFSHGKFSDLVKNVVALPSVLLTAGQNLVPNNGAPKTELPKRFSVEEMGREISENRFGFVEACCVKMAASADKGEFLILPNLKLKVFIEAIRMVFEIVYDERFVTFSYGGRVGMGRHTAIRYLKNSVENPAWWFSVGFSREKFGGQHVDKLCLFIEEKIDDKVLIDIVKRLFEIGVVQIELGGCYFGRGFPQESRLSSILVNVYFDGFDRELQEMRLRKKQENPKFEPNQLVSEDGVFYKPVKIYAVRYLDEILVTTSGSKMLTMDLKNWVVKYLEGRLELKVDRVKTAIHSAVSEKIDFMGMELQAVLPSVLRPPMSEKALRARKKYLRQKEVRALELKNARERNRKKLGLKIFGHLFKKFKQSDGFKFEHQIENEDLVDSYDNFQEQVDKHLSPVKARKALEEEEKRMEEEEERKYAKRTVEDLTRLCMKVDAPIELVRKAVRLVGFTNHMGRPRPISLLTALEDADIVKWYAGVGRRWLDFFCCCHNFKMVKTIVSYHLRFSCILTLAEKHETTKRESIKHYSKDLKIFDMCGNGEVHFPTERDVKMMGDMNLSDPKHVDGALSLALIRLASDEPPYSCVAHFCERTDTTVYRLRLMQKLLNVNPLDEEKWVRGMGAIHDSLNLKCLPLCPDHIHDLYMGKITLQDIDCTSFLDVD
ncbi:Putative COX1/OXI3 intron 2 protein [Morus notabilis]|uniref:Putative COX1/OXI3 intron 2 protein n=1 Tax=Morus notabilis TaxID=981085 RepID=W9S871_9ROSA|nr:Putative COX1/OXI3 intron 2 protein [Morus notabilis]